MRLRIAASAVFALAMSGGTAQAHNFIEGAGFWNGFLHPLLVPAHALALLAFGLMTGQQNSRHRLVLVMLFPAILLAGILLIMFATFSVDAVPFILLGSAAIAGLLAALARPLLFIVPAPLLAAGGLALMFDSVPSVISKRDTILALAGTTLTSALALGLVAYGVAQLTREWQLIGVRIVGSWTAASALLVLALWLARPGE